jgi:hypothetical protein
MNVKKLNQLRRDVEAIQTALKGQLARRLAINVRVRVATKHLCAVIGLCFHFNTPASDYIHGGTGKRWLNDDEAATVDELCQACLNANAELAYEVAADELGLA